MDIECESRLVGPNVIDASLRLEILGRASCNLFHAKLAGGSAASEVARPSWEVKSLARVVVRRVHSSSSGDRGGPKQGFLFWE